VTPPRPSDCHFAHQTSATVACGSLNFSCHLPSERRLTIRITAVNWPRSEVRSSYSTVTGAERILVAWPGAGRMAPCLIAGPGGEGETDVFAHAAVTHRPVTAGGKVSAAWGLANVSVVAITIPTLTANHGVSIAPRIRRRR